MLMQQIGGVLVTVVHRSLITDQTYSGVPERRWRFINQSLKSQLNYLLLLHF
jgi:hypothetical protein